jgi:hypothetical protein
MQKLDMLATASKHQELRSASDGAFHSKAGNWGGGHCINQRVSKEFPAKITDTRRWTGHVARCRYKITSHRAIQRHSNAVVLAE